VHPRRQNPGYAYASFMGVGRILSEGGTGAPYNSMTFLRYRTQYTKLTTCTFRRPITNLKKNLTSPSSGGAALTTYPSKFSPQNMSVLTSGVHVHPLATPRPMVVIHSSVVLLRVLKYHLS